VVSREKREFKGMGGDERETKKRQSRSILKTVAFVDLLHSLEEEVCIEERALKGGGQVLSFFCVLL